MRNLIRGARHSGLVRFLAVNVVVLLAFYLITLAINSRIAVSQEKNVLQTSLGKLDLFANKLEIEVSRQQLILYQIADGYDLQKLSIAGTRLSYYERGRIIKGLQADVLNYQSICEYCDNITVIIPSVQYAISLRPSLADIDAYIDPDDLVDPGIAPLVFRKDRLFSIMTYPKSPVVDRGPLFTILIDLNQAKIREDMGTFFNEEGENMALLGISAGWSLTGDPGIPTELFDLFRKQGDLLQKPIEEPLWIDIGGVRHQVLYRYSPVLDAYFVSYWSESVIGKTTTSTKITIWVVSLFTLLMVLFSFLWIRRFFDVPMLQLMNALGRVEKGDLQMNIQYKGGDEFRYVYDQFNRMVVELNRLIEMDYEQRIRTQQAELKQLQYHIKPHFLYNSIFLIYRMARDGDLETIEDFSLTLGNYYRYITRIQSETIPLQREVEHVRDFIKIQSVRFGSRIAIQLDDIPTGLENQPVVPLMLQPVVENAFHHGVSMMESGGRIRIAISVEDGVLTIRTDDNGKGLSEEEIRDLQAKILENDMSTVNTGLSNVHHRLRIQFGEGSGLSLSSSPLGGLQVTLRIRMEGRGDNG